MVSSATPRQVVILLFDDVQSLDVTGPLEVLAGARRVLESAGPGGRVYETRTLSATGRRLRTSSGLTIVPDGRLNEVADRLDTLIVPGGRGARAAVADASLLGWIADTSKRSRRTASVCTGAFPLAAAGLLDGRRATTHWSAAEALARLYPRVDVDPDPIFVCDGPIWTSAGVTAGMDLALALVEEDLGRDAALTIARHLVLFLRRPGSQSQFSATLAAQQPAREPLREVQRLVLEDVGGDHSVEAMAARALRRARALGGGAPALGGRCRARRGGRLGVRLRHRRDDAANVPARARRRPGGVPQTLSTSDKERRT